jgi:predicted NAD/FAD-binding protein
MRIAIIGAGISGLTAAYLLYRDFDITVFEANDYIGGHTHTIAVSKPDAQYAVDTGFIVFNETTYPNFCNLLKRLNVPSQPTQMTFSVKCEQTGLEWSPHNFNSIFATRRTLLQPGHWRMLLDIARFRNRFKNLLDSSHDQEPLVEYLRRNGFSERFITYFIVPMGASLWSADPQLFDQFPLGTFVRFFYNHGIFEMRHPLQWRVITGGSARYVEKLIAPFADRIRTGCPVQKVRREAGAVEVLCKNGSAKRFDQVIMAAHSDQVLAMLETPNPLEREILEAIPYQENLVMLHTDRSILPMRSWLWSSWNYLISQREQRLATVTYDMNILQGITSPHEFCVTLNKPDGIAPDAVIGKYLYHHPIYTTAAPAAQKRHAEVSGTDRIHYCGAYWGYGFHEDGVRSALAVCKKFGKEL